MSPSYGRGWTAALVAFGACVVALLVAYADTAASFPRVWRGSDTYTHCFFVVPVTAWLVWRKRATLRLLRPTPDAAGFLLLLGFGALWLAADAADVSIYAQFGLAGMVASIALALFGRKVARALLFPFGFFFLAVPFGEFLQPWLMDYTARFTAAGLRVTGVPVHVEGLFLNTPNGRWRVIEACSGLRFLISMFTLGALFAYLRFRRPLTRIGFSLLAIVMSLVANGLRAYVTVLIGYLTDMKVGTGLDHYAIGWALFTAVMALFFFVGGRWQEDPPADADGPGSEHPADDSARTGPVAARGGAAIAAPLLALVLLLAPRAVSSFTAPPPGAAEIALAPPAPAAGWTPQETVGAWRPGFHGTTAELRVSYSERGAPVDCYLGYYHNQRQGAELIHFENVVVPRKDSLWRPVASATVSVPTGGRVLHVVETQVRSEFEHYLVWSWYWLPDEFTSSQVRAKLLQARARVLYRRDVAAVVILSTPYVSDPAEARERLERFTTAMLPAIGAALRRADRAPRAS